MAVGSIVISKSARFSAIISVICGVMLFFLFRHFAPRETSLPGDGYAVLALNSSEDDRCIREILEQAGLENIISESSQYIPLDDFGSLRMVQLDTFHTEIKDIDPRDTGYAARLKDFFVHDGQRFFFIPLEAIGGNRTGNIKSKLDSVLYGIPFSLAFWGHEPPFLLYFALIAVGCIFTLYFSQSRRLFLYQIPVLLAMGWGGGAAALLAAILCGIWELLREPLRELSVARRYNNKRKDYAGDGLRGLLERLKPFKINISLILFFLIFALIFSVTGNLSPVPMIAACLCFFLINYFSFQIEKERASKNKHILFTPVLLFPIRSKTFSLFPFIMPFAAVFLLAVSLPRFFPEFSPPSKNVDLINPGYFVTSEDYYRHMAFQHSFSFRSLNHPHSLDGHAPFNRDSYLHYYLGDDGLIAGSLGPDASLTEDHPFPLEKLMDFLLNYDNKPAAQAVNNSMNTVEWIAVLIIFTACIIDMIRPRILPKKRIPVLRDKRIAA